MQEILRNGFEKMEGHGVTHLDLAAHGTVSLSRCSTLNPLSGGSLHSLPTAAFHTSCAGAHSGGGGEYRQHYHHQEQCPHYNNM